jgi:hypothetical protein
LTPTFRILTPSKSRRANFPIEPAREKTASAKDSISARGRAIQRAQAARPRSWVAAARQKVQSKRAFAAMPPPPAAGALAQTPAAPSPEPTAFVCPKTQTLDCMPIVPAERRALCGKENLDWAAKHYRGPQAVY